MYHTLSSSPPFVPSAGQSSQTPQNLTIEQRVTILEGNVLAIVDDVDFLEDMQVIYGQQILNLEEDTHDLQEDILGLEDVTEGKKIEHLPHWWTFHSKTHSISWDIVAGGQEMGLDYSVEILSVVVCTQVYRVQLPLCRKGFLAWRSESMTWR